MWAECWWGAESWIEERKARGGGEICSGQPQSDVREAMSGCCRAR